MNYTTIHEAADAGDQRAVEQFLRSGVSVHALSDYGAPALQYAAARGHLEIARLLVKAGADVNYLIKDGGTPLMGAAALLKPHMIEFLIANGAQPNKKGVDGHFPLYCPFQPAVAAIRQQLECIRLLVAAGARINEKTDSGSTPLMKAAWFGNAEAAKYLLHLGADPTLKNNDGKAAAIMAFERGHDELAELLKNASNKFAN